MADLQGLSTNELITKSSYLRHAVAGKCQPQKSPLTLDHMAAVPAGGCWEHHNCVFSNFFWLQKPWAAVETRFPSMMGKQPLCLNVCLFDLYTGKYQRTQALRASSGGGFWGQGRNFRSVLPQKSAKLVEVTALNKRFLFSVLRLCSKSNIDGGSFKVFAVRL